MTIGDQLPCHARVYEVSVGRVYLNLRNHITWTTMMGRKTERFFSRFATQVMMWRRF